MLGNKVNQFKKIFELDQGKPATVSDKKRAYGLAPSIAQILPWMEFDGENQCFLLQDGCSVAAMFQIEDIPCEASPELYLLEIRERFQGIFKNTIPQEKECPWHLQFFLTDELSLEAHVKTVRDYVKPTAKGSVFTDLICVGAFCFACK